MFTIRSGISRKIKRSDDGAKVNAENCGEKINFKTMTFNREMSRIRTILVISIMSRNLTWECYLHE